MTSAQIRIPFHLCDPAKILFFGSLYEIYHQFLEDHISDLGVAWKDWFQGEAGAPIRGLKTSYNVPLKFGVTYEAKLTVAKIGQSTVTLKFEVFDENHLLHTITEVTHCFVDPVKRQKTDVPKPIKEALLKHLQS